ncbi:hypothetical protein KEM48_010103 [Puccinia striiformis f. sp. tritici PST-130]|uniref:Uncharacterized protein n=1 Tax=Puccinia striiformis f. sp. tritici PST-78 TaxID=1165861 RepID=A0A0L0VPY5_9BASI|nr:hypothetical protein KEM48_010103 [Puccinia striiformis f. sp. tritici PST-130]KNF01272.1 hypothetical protein PSTG_05367 [Puccinia striiformis f. sp. tritici PST-78]
MVWFSQHQACIKGLMSALENNITSQVIAKALGANNDDSSDKEDQHPSLEDKDLNEDLLFYLQAWCCGWVSCTFFLRRAGDSQVIHESCIMAILRLQFGLLKGPNAYKQKITQKDYTKEGLIDGALIPLFDAPSKNGSVYGSHKGFHAITLLKSKYDLYVHWFAGLFS